MKSGLPWAKTGHHCNYGLPDGPPPTNATLQCYDDDDDDADDDDMHQGPVLERHSTKLGWTVGPVAQRSPVSIHLNRGGGGMCTALKT